MVKKFEKTCIRQSFSLFIFTTNSSKHVVLPRILCIRKVQLRAYIACLYSKCKAGYWTQNCPIFALSPNPTLLLPSSKSWIGIKQAFGLGGTWWWRCYAVLFSQFPQGRWRCWWPKWFSKLLPLVPGARKSVT